MIVILNLIIIFIVLLIAYWWANQGLFSAILHLVCVIAAGAIALALWEPVTVGLLLSGKSFDDYAWGVSLVVLFCVSLLVLRVAADKMAPGNVNIPSWANLSFGFVVGLAAAIITAGILFTGIGFLQSHKEIMGYTGYGRSTRDASVTRTGPGLWLPVHEITTKFYEFLSVGSLYPHFNNTPLAHYNPELYKQASLVRDSFDQGKGKLSLLPSAATVHQLRHDEQNNRYAVEIEFKARARDFGHQLTLSSSQIRLITWPVNGTPQIIHPDAWTQDTQNQGRRRFRFDDATHYITTIPGRESGKFVIEFAVPSGHVPRFIQVRGTRFALPEAQPVPPGSIGWATGPSSSNNVTISPVAGAPIQSLLQVTNRIEPIQVSRNQLPGTMREHERYLVEGTLTYRRGGQHPSRNLIILGIEQPIGTKVVQLNVSRGTAADIFGPVRAQAGENAELALVDSQGNRYSPIGYMHTQTSGAITLRLEPTRFLRTAGDLPILPTAGQDTLKLIFRVTEGTTIVGFRYGDITVGTCNLSVK